MVDSPLTLVGGTAGGDQGPQHEPTEQLRTRVSLLAEAGVQQRAICADIGVAINTLRKYYMRELMLADAKVQALIGQAQLRSALGSPAVYDREGRLLKAEVLPNVTMQMYLGKVRMQQNDGGFRGGLPNSSELEGQSADVLEFNTAGLTGAERIERVTALINVARARRAGRAAPGAGAVGAVPGKPAANGSGEHR
jgi:hypothetical protein